MKWNFDRNLFTQSGLDSGALTMLGSVVHSFQEAGEYRGSVHKPNGEQAVFYLSLDKESSAASVSIDLAALPVAMGAERLASSGGAEGECGCECGQGANRFTVNPKGYVVFHVSQGSGGYDVHVRRAQEDPGKPGRDMGSLAKDNRGKEEQGTKVFNSQQLGEGDMFAASMMRPGTYQVLNTLSKAEGSIVVAYPEVGKTAYRPPAPLHVQVGRDGMDPKRVELKPLQGVVFDIKAPARIVIKLIQPNDGPGRERKTRPQGWSKTPRLIDVTQRTRGRGPSGPDDTKGPTGS